MESSTELVKPKIPIPREISQIIGIGIRQENSEAIKKIAEDIEGLGANPNFTEKTSIMESSINGMIRFLDDLSTKEANFTEPTNPGLYEAAFSGEEEKLVLEKGKKTIDNPVVPKLLHAIFHAIRNHLQKISGLADTTAFNNNEGAKRIINNCARITDYTFLFQDAKGVEVTVEENMRVKLMPITE